MRVGAGVRVRKRKEERDVLSLRVKRLSPVRSSSELTYDENILK
jgi:hypothetical protein